MLMLVVVLKALLEVAGLSLLGQGVLFILAGAGREQNFIYRLFKLIASPAVRITRFITPRRLVPDTGIAPAAFFLVAGLWLALSLAKIDLCHDDPRHPVCADIRPPAASP